MTISELEKEVTALGFDGEIGSKDIFITAVNRALRDIYLQRNILRTVTIYAAGRTPSYYQKEINVKGGSGITLPLNGRAYSMRLCGMGNYRVMDGEDEELFQFDTGYESRLVQGFLTFGGSIRFYGAVSFSIYDFSVYDEIYSIKSKDIPDGSAIKSFDLRSLYSDFLSFAGPATDASGKIIENCKLIDGHVELPSSFKGEIRISYRRLPETVTAEYENDIDIPREYDKLLPLLVSFYVWLDLDVSKANCYLEQYKELLEIISRGSYDKIDFNYINTNGWA